MLVKFVTVTNMTLQHVFSPGDTLVFYTRGAQIPF